VAIQYRNIVVQSSRLSGILMLLNPISYYLCFLSEWEVEVCM
jgi:hypothetical protein